MVKRVGILALQGNFYKHRLLLEQIGVESIYVRYASNLNDINGLIIPGGESTTMTKLIDRAGLYEPIISFAEKKPILGARVPHCARQKDLQTGPRAPKSKIYMLYQKNIICGVS